MFEGENTSSSKEGECLGMSFFIEKESPFSVQQQEAKVKELLQNITCLESELDAVRATNFELTDRVKESEELERDYDGLVEK